MKTIIQVLIVILALVGLYLAIMAFSSWLVVILFNIWAFFLRRSRIAVESYVPRSAALPPCSGQRGSWT